MKTILLIFLMMLCLFFCSPTGDSTQQGTEITELTGVTFERMSFQDTLAKALKDNKVLMVDAFTDT